MKKLLAVVIVLLVLVSVGQLELWKNRPDIGTSFTFTPPEDTIYRCPVCKYEYRTNPMSLNALSLYSIDGEMFCPQCVAKIIKALIPRLREVSK